MYNSVNMEHSYEIEEDTIQYLILRVHSKNMASPIFETSVTIDGLTMDATGTYETDNATYIVNSYVWSINNCGTTHYLTIKAKRTSSIIITGKASSTSEAAWQPNATTSGWKVKLP